jgi:monoterpene epsilon-lactone hydrolase
MDLEEHVIINLLKLIKRRATSDLTKSKSLDIEKVRREMSILRKVVGHVFPPKKDLTIEDYVINGVPCYHTKLPVHTKRIIFYLHGGGYLFDRTNRTREEFLALACQANLWIPEYRLAPEHQHPSAVTDAYNAYLGLLDRGIDPKDIFVMGDSAGGGLALAMLMKLRDDKKPLPTGVVLLSPWTDLSLTGESLKTRSDIDPMLSELLLADAAEIILGGHSALDPYISPLYGNFEGLPPMMVFVGGREVLFDDSSRVVEIAKKHGVDATLFVHESMIHIYVLFDKFFPEAREAVSKIAEFVNKLHKD